MTKKSIILSSLILVVVLTVAVGAYFLFFKNSPPVNDSVIENPSLHQSFSGHSPQSPEISMVQGSSSTINSVPQEEYKLTFHSEVAKIDPALLLPTDNWGIYKDEKDGFEFRYPKEWSVENNKWFYGNNIPEMFFSSSGAADDPSYNGLPTNYPYHSHSWSRITMILMDLPKDGTLMNWLEEEARQPSFPGGPCRDIQYVEIGSNKLIGEYQFDKINWKIAYVDLNNGKFLDFHFIVKGPDEGFSSVLYTMLSTLKIDKK